MLRSVLWIRWRCSAPVLPAMASASWMSSCVARLSGDSYSRAAAQRLAVVYGKLGMQREAAMLNAAAPVAAK